MALKVAIVGRPNVGKSTLFNRLVGKRLALVDDRPGVTRDRRYADGNIGDMDLTLIDTAGYEDVTDDSLESRMREQTEAALEDGDVILFMMDAREGVTSLDRIFADRLRKQHKPVILLANKSESRESGGGIGEAYSLGFGEPVAISAEHGEGMADLYAAMVTASADIFIEEVDEPDKPIRIAIIGRPNAGKSTLINRLIGEDRMLPQVRGAPLVALSAHSGRGVERLMPAILQAWDTWSVKVKTRDLNDWLALAVQRHPPPAVDGKRIKPKYMAQTKARPPTFVLMASRAEAMPEQYKRYLINNLRESFDLPGTPIRLIVKSGSENPYAPGGSKSGPERYKGDAKTAPRRVIKKAEREDRLSNLPGKALEQKKAGKGKVKPLAGLKASANKKAGSSIAVQKGARGGARQVSRSGRIRTGQKHAPKK